jgi:hypothetical protein
MVNIHHKPIKRFSLDGSIHDESAIPRLKLEYIRLLGMEMRLAGYVPKIEIDPDFTIGYNEDKKIFYFSLSVYGIHVGKKQAEWIQGIDGTLVVPIQKSRSKELSQAQESRLNQK